MPRNLRLPFTAGSASPDSLIAVAAQRDAVPVIVGVELVPVLL